MSTLIIDMFIFIPAGYIIRVILEDKQRKDSAMNKAISIEDLREDLAIAFNKYVAVVCNVSEADVDSSSFNELLDDIEALSGGFNS